MKIQLGIFLFIVICMLQALSSEAPRGAEDDECKLKFDNLEDKIDWQGGSGAYAGKYNPFDPLSYAQAISFEVKNEKDAACPYFVDAEPGENTGTYDRELEEGGERLQYNIYLDASLSQIWMGAETGSGSVIQGFAEAEKDSRTTHTYYFNIEPLQLVSGHKSKKFKDKVKLGLWRGSFDSPDRRRDDDQKVEFQTIVPKVVDVSLVDAGSGFISGQVNRLVNFGTLIINATENFDLIVRYNNKYELTFESTNDGAMVNSTASNIEVSYEFTVNSEVYDLTKKSSKKIKDQNNTGYDGDRHQLQVRITEDVSEKEQGIYTDVITGVIKAK
jgi:hypothetical protein